MMRLHHLLGQDSEALKQYEICQQLLERELGIDPAPETRALAYEIAGRSGSQTPAWLPQAARTSQHWLLEHPERLPMIGRQVELAGLLRMLENTGHAAGGMALVYGEAGVGKTRLLEELARNADWRGWKVAWGRCYEMSGQPAYQPLLEVLRSDLDALDSVNLEDLWRAEMARLLPELAANHPLAELKPEEEQRRLLEALTRAFLALSHAAARLVLLEDAHWMDHASLAALRYLLPRLAQTPLLVVICVRSEDLSPQQAAALASLENTRLVRRFDLDRLNLAETGQLVQQALEMETPPMLFSARLYAETEGNPFFVTETLQSLMEDGMLYRNRSGDWSTSWDDISDDYAELPLPGSISQSIQRRLHHLPAALLDALSLAAVIGRTVSFDLWRQASGAPELDLLQAADELCRRGLLQCSEGFSFAAGGETADFRFSHDKIRRVTYEQQSAPARRRRHQSVAQALMQLAPDRLEALAYHLSAARVWDQAALYHQQAGERAMQVYALDEALSHFNQALEALKQVPGQPDLRREYALRLGCERVYDLQGARQAQSAELACLGQLAQSLGDSRLQAEAALRQVRQADMLSDFPATITVAQRAVELARLAGDATIETESCMEWGWALLMQGEHLAAVSQFEMALQLARQAGLPRLEADGLHGLGTVHLVTGDYAAAKGYFNQVLEIASRIDVRPRQATTLANLGFIATAQGDYTASKIFGEQALSIHRQTGDQRGAALVMQNLADIFLAEGDFSTARKYLEQALVIQQITQAQDNVGGILGALGLYFHKLGDYEQARRYYLQAGQIFQELGIRWYQGQNLAFLSLLEYHLGNHQAAWQTSQQGLQIAREIGDRLAEGWLLDCAGHALAGLGQYEQAEQSYRQALSLRQERNELQKAAESLAGLARLALQHNDLAAAREYTDLVLQIYAEHGLAGANEPFQVYLTCYQVLTALKDGRAADLLTHAYLELMKQSGKIDDDRLARSFVENVAANRQLIASQSARQGKQITVRLPRAGAPTGRALRPEEFVEVIWAVAALEDEDIPQPTRRRQQRLLRLLEQAQAQGAAPTYENLADALQVNLRTIQRDMHNLRQSHDALPSTRGNLSS